MSIDQYDQQQLYCRRLGHPVPFHYCRRENQNKPCFKIKDCWFSKIPVTSFLNRHYSGKELQDFLKPPDKITSIFKIAERFK